MKLTSSDIRAKKFKSRISGFNPGEVQKFLGEIADQLDELTKSHSGLKEKIIELETRLKDYTSIEKAIQQTFMQAQETSTRSLDNARKEAHLIIQEAEVKATQIVEEARVGLSLLKEQMTILKAKKDSIVARLKMMLNSEFDLIKALEIDEEFKSKIEDDSGEAISKKTEIEEIVRQLG